MKHESNELALMKRQGDKLARALKGIKENVLQLFGKTRIPQSIPDIMAHIDEPRNHQISWSRILVRGWAIPPKKIKWIEVNHDDRYKDKIKIGNEVRPDLALVFPSILDAKYGGFFAPIKLGTKEGKCKLIFSAISTEDKIELGEKIIVNSESIINHPPENFCIAPTSRCNLSCTMCPIHSNQDFDNKFNIKQSTIDLILNDFKYYSHHIKNIDLTPTYGEPFLYRDIFKLVDQIQKVCPNAKISLTTNGTMFSKVFIEKILDSKLTDIVISLDASSKTFYEKIRKGANFEHTMAGLCKLINMRNRRKKKLPRIGTNFNFMQSNIHEFPDYVRNSIKVGVDYIYANNVHGFFDSDYGEHIYIMPGDHNRLASSRHASYAKIIREAQMVAEKAKVEYYFPSITPSEPFLDCRYGARTRPYIDKTGDIYPCCVVHTIAYSQGGSFKPFGNVKENSLNEIWESKPYQRFRKAFFTGDIPDQNCKKCHLFYNM